MKKPVTLIAFLCFQMMFWAQLVPTKIKALETKKIIKTEVGKKDKDDAAKDQLVSYEFSLNSIAIAEASRNTIDNNDCRQTWGEVNVTFRELDANGEINVNVPPIKTDLNQKNLFDIFAGDNAFHRSNSYYGDNREVDSNNYIKRISVRVSEKLVKERRIVAVVECVMKNAHKDNDFASFDHLRMTEKKIVYFYLEDIPSKEEVMLVKTDGYYSVYTARGGTVVSSAYQGNPDDSHRIWLFFTVKKKS